MEYSLAGMHPKELAGGPVIDSTPVICAPFIA